VARLVRATKIFRLRVVRDAKKEAAREACRRKRAH
jgi:hypothetical protein